MTGVQTCALPIYDLIFERFLLPERAGLYEGETTIFAKDIESQEYIKVEIDGKTINLDKDAEVIVYREGVDKPIRIYADEIVVGDDIIFDNRDILFTINEL